MGCSIKLLLLILTFFIAFHVISYVYAADDYPSCSIQHYPPPSGPGGDHPDESYAVDSGNPAISYVTQNPTLITLMQGYYENFTTLSAMFKYSGVHTDIHSASNTLLNSSKLLLIPSGGLYGLENSAFFKASLDEYVKQGGTLVVFAQQRGYEFSALPVPQEADGLYRKVTGYGWTEDQSCFLNAVYIDTWHQILVGQSRSTPTLNVDGYFTDYPSSATVILRRTKNGQPAMIAYPYGDGMVIATTMYSDWAYGRSQASKEEIVLVRDLISWAKKPAQLPEVKPGGTVSMSLTIVNESAIDAYSIKLTVLDSNRNIIAEQTVLSGVPAGGSATIPFSYTTISTNPLGIWHVDYTLIDASGNTIQPQAETDSGRFAVSNPPTNPYKSRDFSFSVQSDAEYYLYGSDGNFTVFIWNNTDVAKDITIEYSVYSHESGEQMITVPAKGIASYTFTIINVHYSTRFWAYFYDSNGTLLGRAQKGFYAVNPSALMTVATDNTSYRDGDMVLINTSVKNSRSASWQSNVKIAIYNPQNTKVFEDTQTVTLSPYGTGSVSTSYTLPATLAAGVYIVRVEAWYGSKLASSASKSFELLMSQISATPSLPPFFTVGLNNVPFTLTNIGKIGISQGAINISLIDPESVIVSTYSQFFTLGVGESKTIDVLLNVPSFKFGNYTLTYAQSDETKTGSPAIVTISNIVTIGLSFNKPSYRLRETANLTVNLTNTGKFNLDSVSVNVSVPDTGYDETRTVSFLSPNTSPPWGEVFSFVIPDTISSGQHNVDLTLMLSSGSSMAQTTKFTILKSALSVVYTGSTMLTVGDMISLAVENTGGVDASYITELTIADSNGLKIYQGNLTGAVMAGEKKLLTDVQMPLQTAKGGVNLSVKLKDTKTGKISQLSRLIDINGVTAGLTVKTDKNSYLAAEGITSFGTIANGGFNLTGGTLDIKIKKPVALGRFERFPSISYWWSFAYSIDAAIDANGNVYIVDSAGISNAFVFKFDKKGNLITKWGSSGTGPGQFYRPSGIAVSEDGFVYVIDAPRIQKFDRNGNFVKMWGGYGAAFYSLSDTAVAPDGSVYVTDFIGVQKFDSNGNYITRWGQGQFINPSGIAVALDGSVYVVDSYNHRIQKFDSNGNFITKWGSYGAGDGQFRLIHPYSLVGGGIATASDGSVYVADIGNHRIQKFDRNGNFIAKWGSFGYNDGQFNYPSGISVDADAYLYVADTYNHRIQRMPAGFISVFETTIPVTQSADTTQEYITNIGTLNTTGKLYLEAALKNSLGQTIDKDIYPFYVAQGNTVLLFNTDKKIYKPGEIVTITGEVKNLASVSLGNALLSLTAGTNTLISRTITVPAQGSYPFSVTTTAGSQGIVTLTGKVVQNNVTLVEITDSYEVANPSIAITVTAPDVVGKSPFDITVEIKNDGKVDTALQILVTGGQLSDIQQLTVKAGETQLLQYNQAITQTTTYAVNITGDVTKILSRQVVYGEVAQIVFGLSAAYPEGKAAVPVTITNTSTIDEMLDVTFRLNQGQASLSEETRTYYLPKDASITDTLYYDLLKGEYTVSAESAAPQSSAQAAFKVLKENDIAVTMSIGSQSDGLIPVTVTVTNNGYNDISGSLVLDAGFWNGNVDINLASGQTINQTFNVNPEATMPGTYQVKAVLYNSSGNELATATGQVLIQGALFEITQLPPYSTFIFGGEGSFTFVVKNTGNQEGEVSFTLKVMDVLDQTVTEWLKPGEEKTFTFNFLLPDDIEEKDYFADYTLTPTLSQGERGQNEKGQIKFHVNGIDISVNAALDKPNYHEGDTALLTLVIADKGASGDVNLFARVNYNGYEEQKTFTLSGGATILTFSVPLTAITGEKVFYGIYHESGRSIHLNSLYIYRAGDVITITTDKQVYNPGEIVSVAISGTASGQMTLSGPGDYSEAFNFTGSASKSFALPYQMTAGTYYISYSLTPSSGETITGSHPIDVAGIQVKVKEATLDKAKYASIDNLNLTLTIESNRNVTAQLKTWIVDPDGDYAPSGSQGINLTSAQNLIATHSTSLSTDKLGIHRLVYGIYGEGLLLVSGSEAFDVGDAVLLGVSTDKTDYPNGDETVNVSSSLYGTVSGTLEFFIDDISAGAETVFLIGFVTHTRELTNISPGAHTLKVVLTSGGLISTKETSFIYGGKLPDLIVAGLKADRIGSTYRIEGTVVNQGKTLAASTTVAFYNGNTLLAALAAPALNPDESVYVSYDWNVLGNAGGHAINAAADAGNSVREFNETNNARSIDITVPELILNVSSDKPEYKANEDAGITVEFANLTSAVRYEGIGLSATINDPDGESVFNKTNDIALLAPATESSYTFIWNSGATLPGDYTVTGRLIKITDAMGTTLVENGASFTILPTPSVAGEFSLSKNTVIQGFDLKIAYTLTNNGNIDISGGDVAAEFVPVGSDASVDSYTKTLGALKVLEITSDAISIDTLDINPGDYIVRVLASVEGASFIIGDLPLKVLPPLEVTKRLSLASRVLVLLNKVNKDAKDPAESVIREALDSLGVHYNVARDIKGFKEAMRSGVYNTYILAGREPIAGRVDDELIERINSGEGLILVNYEAMEYEKFKEIAGVKNIGSLPQKNRTAMLSESPIGEEGTIGIGGKVQRLEIVSNKAVAAGTVSERNKTYPVVILNEYGNGNVITVAFDVGTSAKTFGTTLPYSRLLQGGINHTAPKEVMPISGCPLGIEIGFKSFGASFDLKVKEEIETEGVLFTYPDGRVDETGITWEFTLGADGEEKLNYLTTADESGGTYVNTTVVEYIRDGVYESYNAYPLEIQSESIAALEMRILSHLQELPGTAAITEKYQSLINMPLATRQDIRKAIQELLSVIDDLNAIGGDSMTIRLAMDDLLKIFERKWQVAQDK